MARIRNVKPDYYDDVDLSNLSLPARYLYKALWHWLDRQGVGPAKTKFWKAKVFPYDDKVRSSDVHSWLNELLTHNRIFIFTHEGKELFYCPNMLKHQKFHKDEKPKYAFQQSFLDDVVRRACQHPTSTLPAPKKHPSDSDEIGNRKSEIGIETYVSSEAFSGKPDNAPIKELQGDEEVDYLLSKVSQKSQKRWLKLFNNQTAFVKHELLKALDWIEKNPRRKPQSERGYAMFCTTWLNRAWPRYQKSIPANGQSEKTPIPIEKRKFIE